MKKTSFTSAQLIHWSLYGLIVLLVAGIGYGVYFTHQKLSEYVAVVDHLKIDSEINQQGIENAQKLQKALDDNRDSVSRAEAIVADTKYYEYQDQIVKDIGSYAAASGITVLGFDFSAAASKNSSIKGIKTMVATISLQSPVQYADYLKFLKLVERNLTKMQVTQMDIANDLKTPGTISSPVLTLEVYVR